MGICDRDDAPLTAIGCEFSEMGCMCISELDEWLDDILDCLLWSSDYIIEGVSSQVVYITTRFYEWGWEYKNPNWSFCHHPKIWEIYKYLYWYIEYYFRELSQYIDIWFWVSDDDMFLSYDNKTLQYEESSRRTTGMRIGN